MLIGVAVPNAGPLARTDALVRLGAKAEEDGFDSVWVADHLIIPAESSQSYPYARQAGMPLSPDWPFLDPLIALAAIASRTSRVLLGTGVYLLPLRHPLATAKAAASLDVLSGGRLLLGVGLGWISEEYAAVGVPWAERGRIMDEQIALLRALWREERPRFTGAYWKLDGFGFEPKPANVDIPILIGGNGPPARRRAARLGDGWHVIDLEPQELATCARASVADSEALGRAKRPALSMYASIAVTERPIAAAEREFPLMGSVDQIAERLIAYRDAGLDHIVLAARGLASIQAYEELFAIIRDDIVPRTRAE
ncbi:MAG TPA: TIGR03619 family F420-dependent LLM class oxidoreductase [Alphaproteobacteria bacterium]|nr:TIGR03619 family F420-dependent LLM class oxidoreductase [Alphaproteobacteria bacterium]